MEVDEVHRSLDNSNLGCIANKVVEEKLEPWNAVEELGEMAYNLSTVTSILIRCFYLT